MAKRRTQEPSNPQDDVVSPEQNSSKKKSKRSPAAAAEDESKSCFVGKPILANEARSKWPHRYLSKGEKDSDGSSNKETSGNGDVLKAKCHYRQARVDGVLYSLNDHAYVKAEEGELDYIARIVEMFETDSNEQYFSAQWFYRAKDTVIKDRGDIDPKRVFISDVKDDNPLDSIVSKVKLVLIPPNEDLAKKKRKIASCDLYYDLKYTEKFHTFSNIVNEIGASESNGSSTVSSESGSPGKLDNTKNVNGKIDPNNESDSSEWTLLDLYSGCGAMSTGLCFGASISGIKLVTRWAVDINQHACKSLKLNHPETQVRNEQAEDFLNLIKAWAKLCEEFSLLGSESEDSNTDMDDDDANDEVEDANNEASPKKPSDSEDFEVEKLLAVCYGDPNDVKKPGVYFKVRWRGYDSSEDTWEPLDGLSDCKEVLKDFVKRGYKKKLLPLPGDADFICGGPPCQGVSGFNRFRNYEDPLNDVKNRQLLVYMDIIDYLKPKYVLMENVVDILKFAGGFLGRYAIGRLVGMNYQARMGIMAAGSYGLPQFRLRVFLWGARLTEKLPPYPLPTHEVVSRGSPPVEFEDITVAYDNKETCQLSPALLLEDAISDLPSVANDEAQDERNYGTVARTEFQKYIRLSKTEILNNAATAQSRRILYDHRPLQLNKDDYDRVCQIPKRKGANFRDLPGVLVKDNRVEWDPSVERVLLESGKPLVPDYAMTFVRGTSPKPFGRLWWDEIVSTVVTRAEPHNQVILHPKQDRVLTIRENARLQGFPDCYKLTGPIKERYIQVGNAVAVPVALALGYTFGLACQGLSGDEPLTTLPFKYPKCLARSSVSQIKNEDDD